MMKLILALALLIGAVTAQQPITYCYRDETKITQDAGGVGLFDKVTVDNTQHQMSPYDLQPFDVFVSMSATDNGVKCGTVQKPGVNQVHEVDCKGTKGQFLHFVAKDEYLVICSLDIQGRPLPVTTTPEPTTAAPTVPAKLNDKCEEVAQADIFFVIDASGSVLLDGFNKEKAFVAAVIKQLNHVRPDGNGIRIGALTYSFAHMIRMGPGLKTFQSNEAIRNAINAMHWTRGGTFTAQALQKAETEMVANARPGIPQIVVTLTDGESNSEVQTIDAANALKRRGYHLMSVGIGKSLRRSELIAMADKPEDKFMFIVNDFTLLDAIAGKVKKAMFCAPANP